MTDRQNLEQLAEQHRKLYELNARKNELMVTLIRACLTRLRSPNAKLRKEALDALAQLADTLEGE